LIGITLLLDLHHLCAEGARIDVLRDLEKPWALMSDRSIAPGAGMVIRHREVGLWEFGVFASGARMRFFA
jgi:hypothetical protein